MDLFTMSDTLGGRVGKLKSAINTQSESTIPASAEKNWGKLWKILFRIVGASTEILTRHLRTLSQKC